MREKELPENNIQDKNKTIKKRILLIASVIFVAAELIFAVLIQKVGGEANKYVSYASVAVACLFFISFAEKSWAYAFTQLALVMTLFADYYLVILPEMEQVTAMIFFSVAQLAYCMRLYLSTESRRGRMFQFAFRVEVLVFAIILTFIVLRYMTDTLSVISMFYFANLVSNIIFAFVQFKKNYLFAIGLVLFACCDILIGFSLLGNYLEIPPDSLAYKLAHPGFNLAWMFYVPSQTLIALSLLPQKLKKLSKI